MCFMQCILKSGNVFSRILAEAEIDVGAITTICESSNIKLIITLTRIQ